MKNQVNAFDADSTSLARVIKRRDELRARGVRGGVVGKLNRLICNMENPTRHNGVSTGWMITEKDRLGGGRNKVRQTKVEEKKKGRKLGK